jgi:hypothetical protein
VPVDLRPADLLGSGSELECVADIWAADATAARAAAELAAWIAQLARRRRIDRQRDAAEFDPAGRPGRDTLDRRPPCLADVSETFVPELALIRGCTEAEAAVLAVESLVLVERLPEVGSELYAGRIDRHRAAVLADLLGEVAPQTAAAVPAAVLPGAGARTAPALRERTRRVLARVAPTPSTAAAGPPPAAPTCGCGRSTRGSPRSSPSCPPPTRTPAPTPFAATPTCCAPAATSARSACCGPR